MPALRAKDVWAPVIMLTARDSVEDRVRGLDAGADDYLVKPFSLLELTARLRALARRGDAPRPALLAAGDLKLDPAAKRAWRGGTELRLSPKEFALLELFLRHPGDVLTRSQIIEAVWDFAYEGGSNVVDQYVTYLRRKVDAPFGRHDIETVRGMGYRLLRPSRGRDMSIRLRLALGFAVAAAALFTVGAWLFAATLSAAQLRVIDSQLTAQLATAARYVPGTAQPTVAAVPGDYLVQVVDAAGQVVGRSPDAGTIPLLSPSQLNQARQSPVSVTTTAGRKKRSGCGSPAPR